MSANDAALASAVARISSELQAAPDRFAAKTRHQGYQDFGNRNVRDVILLVKAIATVPCERMTLTQGANGCIVRPFDTQKFPSALPRVA